MKKLLFPVLLFLSLACSLIGAPIPSPTEGTVGGGETPTETAASPVGATQPQVPTETAGVTPAGQPTRPLPPKGGKPSMTGQPPAGSPCGNGVCEGPENPQKCPADCGTGGSPVAPQNAGTGQKYTVTNPASGASLAVFVNAPANTSSPSPALILVPGGSGSSASFRKPNGEFYAFPQAGYAVIVFDPDGRGQSTGKEDYNGFIQQDGLAAVIEFAATLPGVDAARIGLISYSYGITMASGALARHPDLPVKFLIDWEGPANRDDTGGCDAGSLGHLQDVASCTDEAFWAQREASTFIAQIRVPYQRIQSQKDHVQPDNIHAILMVNNAVAGGVPWVRLNDLPPNQTYDPANPPAMLSEEESNVLPALVLKYLRQMFEMLN
jgi:pimeloyl-ACP methyl ester carboxylesterase